MDNAFLYFICLLAFVIFCVTIDSMWRAWILGSSLKQALKNLDKEGFQNAVNQISGAPPAPPRPPSS